MGIEAIYRKPNTSKAASGHKIYRKPNTSKAASGHKIYPYLLRGVAVERPNQAWARLAKVPAAKPLE
jgi:hypothetical protein